MTSKGKVLSNIYKYLLKILLIFAIMSVSHGLVLADSYGATKDNSYEINNYDFKNQLCKSVPILYSYSFISFSILSEFNITASVLPS